jgi:hypothetical protein
MYNVLSFPLIINLPFIERRIQWTTKKKRTYYEVGFVWFRGQCVVVKPLHDTRNIVCVGRARGAGPGLRGKRRLEEIQTTLIISKYE